jgi:hypothetical protein
MKDKIDEALKETFPASDTPFYVGAGAEKPTRSGRDKSHGDPHDVPARQTREGSRREHTGSIDEELDRLDEEGAHERAKG